MLPAMIRWLLTLALLLGAWIHQGAPLQAASELCVSVSAANVRGAPSLQAGIVKSKQRSDRITVLRTVGDWHEVALGSGGTAWMHTSVLAACAQPSTSAPPTSSLALDREVRDRVLHSLVQVRTLRAQGSGVVLSSDGQDILTAYHVVTTAEGGPASPLVLVRNEADPTWRQADYVHGWPELDLALYRARGGLTASNPASLASAGSLSPGAVLHALGYPSEGLSQVSGVYAGAGGIPYVPSGTFRACVRAGFSGGPAFTSSGQVVGIVTRSTGSRVCGARFVQIEAAQQALAALGRQLQPAAARSAAAQGLPALQAHTEALILELSTWIRKVNATPREAWWDTFCGQGWWNDRVLTLQAQVAGTSGEEGTRARLAQLLQAFQRMEASKAQFCSAPEDGGSLIGNDGRWLQFSADLDALFDAWGS